MVTVGGIGSLAGAIVGAFVITLLPEYLRVLDEYRMVIFGAMLIAFMGLGHRGLAGLSAAVAMRLLRLRPQSDTASSPIPHADAVASSALKSPMTALLALDQLTRQFGGVTAVNSVSMNVEGGEIRGLIGPNGAGKTTTLNLISGLTTPTSGRMTLVGQDVTGEPAHRLARRGVRRTFQNLKLFTELTVLQNVMIGLHTNGTSGVFEAILATGKQRREEEMMHRDSLMSLETVGLVDQADRPASALAYRPPAPAGDRPRDRRTPDAPPARRTGRRPECDGGRSARRADPAD